MNCEDSPLTINSMFAKVFKGSTYSLLLKISTTDLNFLIAIMLARSLEPTGYGQYVLAMTAITFLAIPTTLSLPNFIDRLVIDCHVGNDKIKNIRILVVAESEKQASTSYTYSNAVYHAA